MGKFTVFQPDANEFSACCASTTEQADSEPVAPLACKVAYLTINDASRMARDSFAAALFETLAPRAFGDDDTFGISRAREPVDLVLIGGGDAVRLCRYVKLNQPLLANVACIALSGGTTPTRRARMLLAGFDEVIDCARMSLAEARARVAAVLGRYDQALAARNAAAAVCHSLAAWCNPAALSPRERQVLQVLAANLGYVVSAKALCDAVAPRDIFAFRRALKVTISGLRRKLKPGHMITADYRGGYALHAVAPASPGATVNHADTVLANLGNAIPE